MAELDMLGSGSLGTAASSRVPAGLVGIEPTEQGESGTLRDLVAVCWRHRWVFLGVSFGIASAFYIDSLRVVPLFESRATLEVFLATKRVAFQDDSEYPGRIENGILNTQTAKFLSTPVLARALETSDLGSAPAYRQSAAPVAELRSRIKVTTSRDSWAFDVSLRDEDGERARRGLEALLASYFTQLDERTSNSANTSVTFLGREVEKARKRLDEARQDEQSLREAHAITSANPDDNEFTKRLTALTSQRADLDRNISQCEAQVVEIRAGMSLNDEQQRLQQFLHVEPIGRDTLVTEQQQLLFQCEAEQRELTQKYGAKHPRMKEKQLELEAKRRQLADAIDLARSSIIANYEGLKRQSGDLDRRIARAKQDLADYRENLVRLQALSQESRNREELLDQLSRRRSEEEVLAKMDAKQVSVIDPPEPAIGPVNVSHSRSLAMALFLGLVAGVLSVLGFEKMDPRVRGSSAVRDLTRLPLLGRVPRLRTPSAGPDGAEAALLMTAFIGESYKQLRSTIRLTAVRRICRRLAVVSPSPGDGKSTVAHHLSCALADGGSRVLLVDADMRHPSQDELFGEPTEVGLSMLLAGNQSVSPRRSQRANLDYLGVGVRPPNPADLLCSPELERFLERCSGDYDFILIDTPPLNFVTDALIVGALCDELVLVVRDLATTRGAISDTMQRLEPLRPKVLGFVLNAARERNEAGTYYIFKGES